MNKKGVKTGMNLHDSKILLISASKNFQLRITKEDFIKKKQQQEGKKTFQKEKSTFLGVDLIQRYNHYVLYVDRCL